MKNAKCKMSPKSFLKLQIDLLLQPSPFPTQPNPPHLKAKPSPNFFKKKIKFHIVKAS